MKNCRSTIEFAHLNNRWFLRKEFCSIVLNRSEHPNGCCFRKPIVFIDVFNPHKSSTLNRLTSAPSSMPFISNFDFSYPKCHVFESHCRYQKFQSSWLLGWIFLMYRKLHKTVRVSKTLMRGRLRRKWRQAQPAFVHAKVPKFWNFGTSFCHILNKITTV